MTDRQNPYKKSILVVDDDVAAIDSAMLTMMRGGLYEVIACLDSRKVIDQLAEHEFAAIILDLYMPHISGLELLPQIVAQYPQVPVIIVTGVNEIDTAVQCMKAGAFDYLVKPVSAGRILSVVHHAVSYRDLNDEYQLFKENVLRDELKKPQAFSEIVTQNKKMRTVFQYIEAIAPSARPILVTGETGVGKELIARAIQAVSGVPGPFVSVNVAGLDDHLFSDTLFGHTKGAFTGAERIRAGMVEKAANGTIFLDEIGDLTLASQTKLLRLLQENEYLPLGADMPKRSTARVITATNRDLELEIEEGRFRPDLYFRLMSHHIHLPPLRQRMDDLPLLVEHFLAKAAEALKKKKPTPPPELYALLATHNFPGNIRELEALLFQALGSHTSRVLSLATFNAYLDKKRAVTAPVRLSHQEGATPFADFSVLPPLNEAQKYLIKEGLKRSGGNQSLAAKLLGISQSGLNKAIKRFQL